MTRAGASESVSRMLSLLPYVAARPEGVPIEDLCRRFEVSRDRLLDDLEIVALVGVAPYTPDLLVEVVVEQDRVFVFLPQAFDRPLRLTPDEGLALLAAGRSLMSVTGAEADGPMARALAKLAAVLEVDPERLEIDLGPAEVENLTSIQEAIADHRRIHLRYYSYDRDDVTDREVDPYRLFHERGHWYLAAFCHRATDDRVFRVDRMQDVVPTDTTFTPPSPAPAGGSFQPTPDDPRVTLDLDSSLGWVIDQYPTESVTPIDDGRIRVTLVVAARAWLERLLVRLGPGASVVEAPEDLADAGPEAAGRILARYARRGSGR